MRPTLEVADIFRRHGEAFRRSHGAHLGRIERRVMAAIELCRTPALGGHVEQCGDCGLVRCAYNSCRNRHCPKCQGLARAECSRRVRPSCCRCRTTTWSSPYHRRWRRSRSRTSERFTPSCSTLRPKRCATSPPSHVTSVQRSVQSRCCTLGGRPCSTTRICTALSQAVAFRRIKLDGWRADRGSFCRCASSRDGSEHCSSHDCRRRSWPASCVSPAHSRPWPRPTPSPNVSIPCARSNAE